MAKTSRKKKTDDLPSFTGEERIVALPGKQTFLQQEYTRILREATAKATGGEIDVLTFDGSSAQLAEVLDELRSVGLMMQQKMVIVDPADGFVSRNREALERYAASPEPTATLVLRAETWNRGKLDQKIEKVGAIHKCDDVTPAFARKWMGDRARSMHQVKLARDAADALVDRIGPDVGRLDGELAKLASAVEPGKPITAELVRQMVGRSSEEKAFEMQAALLSGDPAEAVGKLHELMELARHHEQLMLFVFADLARKLGRAAVMLEAGASDKAVCDALKVFPFDRRKPFMRAARRLGSHGAARMLHLLTEMDTRAKTGFGQTTRSLEQFAVLLSRRLR